MEYYQAPTITEELKKDITEYVKNNDRQSSVDIVSHFKLRMDITLLALSQLVDSEVLRRVDHFAGGFDGHHHYEVV